MVYSALSDSTTRSQFTRRKSIIITTNGTNTPADYQVKLTISYESEMQADFDDIRFNTKAGGYIDYWIESYTASTSAVVWVELPDAITHPGSDIISMYYGNSGLSNGGSGADTFLFFDDFPGSSIDTEKWDGNTADASVSGGIMSFGGNNSTASMQSIPQFSTDMVIRSNIKMLDPATHVDIFGVRNPAVSHLAYIAYHYTPYNRIRTRDGLTETYVSTNIPEDTWFILDLKILLGTSVAFFWDGIEGTNSPKTTNPPDINDLEVMFVGRAESTCIQSEWVCVSSAIDNEPTPSYGTAQHQRRIPQFIG